MDRLWTALIDYCLANMNDFVSFLIVVGAIIVVLIVILIGCLVSDKSSFRDRELKLRERQMKLDEKKADEIVKLSDGMPKLIKALSDAELSQEIIHQSRQAVEAAEHFLEEER